MKYWIISVLLLVFSGPVCAQNRHDKNWVFPRLHLGGNMLFFDGDTLNISALGATEGRAREALACMSDKDGHLLFYTNNCTVFDRNHNIMENGEGMNPGQIQTYWCTVNPYANPNENSLMILPQPNNDDVYQIFHWDYEAFNVGQPGGSKFGPLHLYHTVVDMSENNGLGKVMSKNNLILADTFSSCALQAVRHANGRDWWVIAPEFYGNCYYKILLDPSGVHVVDKQCIGSDWGKYGEGSSSFIKNGSRYIRCDIEYGLNLFDFDRCSGELSNSLHIPIGPQGAFLINNMTVSPNGRFAYYHTLKEIYQFDLESADIGASKTLVATYDGFVSVNQTDFYKSQLAPDGKIYINSFGPVYYLHVIEHPDSAGLACTVRQHAIQLPNYHFAAMPDYPDYRLGALAGSPCDTISVSTYSPENRLNITISPNPATTHFTIALPEGIHDARFSILDLQGRVLREENITSSSQQVSTEGLSNGTYFLRLEGEVTGVQKLVVLR
ncbi:MAG: T9SS type A sorting domain-containing protein [Saprospiraceae bacterium]|nr:T9SS type A sorting domain-containing protein [Saprospiraceae bacterium]